MNIKKFEEFGKVNESYNEHDIVMLKNNGSVGTIIHKYDNALPHWYEIELEDGQIVSAKDNELLPYNPEADEINSSDLEAASNLHSKIANDNKSDKEKILAILQEELDKANKDYSIPHQEEYEYSAHNAKISLLEDIIYKVNKI